MMERYFTIKVSDSEYYELIERAESHQHLEEYEWSIIQGWPIHPEEKHNNLLNKGE